MKERRLVWIRAAISLTENKFTRQIKLYYVYLVSYNNNTEHLELWRRSVHPILALEPKRQGVGIILNITDITWFSKDLPFTDY